MFLAYLYMETKFTNHRKRGGNESYLKKKVYRVAKKTLDFLSKNQKALAIAAFSYLVIEVGVVASELAFRDKYISHVESCRNLLCSELKKVDSSQNIPSHIKSHCHSSSSKTTSWYAFKECIDNLCEFMNLMGQKFYACTGIFNKSVSQIPNTLSVDSTESMETKSNFTLELWNKLCPKKKFRQRDKLQELAYLNKCIKRVCKHTSLSTVNLDKSIMNWCNTISVNKLYKLLRRLTHILDESQKKNPDEWTQANIIGTLVTAVSAIVVGATSIIGTIITCKTAKAASSVARNIPSLTSGLQTIVTGTTETTRAILQATGTGTVEVIPMETLNIMSQISETLSHSFSYYSVEDIPLESGVVNIQSGSNVGAESMDTHIESMAENIALGEEAIPQSIVEAAGAAVGSAGSVIGGTISQVGAIATSVLGSVGVAVLSKSGDNTLSDRAEENNAITNTEKTEKNYLDTLVVNPTESHNITDVETLRLKDSLLDWNNSFCFFDSPNLACRLPSPRHSMERMILIPLDNLRKMFSETLPRLCYSFSQELWCNWSKFFDVYSAERNATQYSDSCPWDQFFLSIKETSNNLYQIASGIRENGCYNETVMIKV